MATKKITDLVEITTAAADDVLPIVDVSLDITNKITTTNLLKSKQDLLESGTNIKTINSTSLLGSGDISIEANPSGGAGAIQFSDGSAFASDAANLFWDDANNRLGVGTNAPISELTINSLSTWIAGFNANLRLNAASPSLQLKTNTGDGGFMIAQSGGITYFSRSANSTFTSKNDVGNITGNNWSLGSGVTSNLGAALGIKGSGTTSATIALLVQNSAGTNILSINDGGNFSTTTSNFSSVMTNDSNSLQVTGSIAAIRVGTSITIAASAILQADSTTKGFLPPRMTTTQKNAIATPAAGLVVYDTTLNKLCVYTTAWETITSL